MTELSFRNHLIAAITLSALSFILSIIGLIIGPWHELPLLSVILAGTSLGYLGVIIYRARMDGLI